MVHKIKEMSIKKTDYIWYQPFLRSQRDSNPYYHLERVVT